LTDTNGKNKIENEKIVS